jgi:hypothetical protein
MMLIIMTGLIIWLDLVAAAVVNIAFKMSLLEVMLHATMHLYLNGSPNII